MRLIIATDESDEEEPDVNYIDAKTFARIAVLVMESRSQIRAGEQRNAPAEAGGGWTCTKCKTANGDDKSICGFCDTPRLGG